jgi:hypothetical protein
MGIFDTIAGAVGKLVGSGVKPILDKFIGDKMSDAEKAAFQLEIEKLTADVVQREKDSFQDFVIEHTGAAKDMPKSIQILRGTVRPVITYATFAAFIWISWWVFNNLSALIDANQIVVIKEIQVTTKAILIIVMGFWFGERLITRTGLGSLLLGRRNNASSSD